MMGLWAVSSIKQTAVRQDWAPGSGMARGELPGTPMPWAWESRSIIMVIPDTEKDVTNFGEVTVVIQGAPKRCWGLSSGSYFEKLALIRGP